MWMWMKGMVLMLGLVCLCVSLCVCVCVYVVHAKSGNSIGCFAVNITPQHTTHNAQRTIARTNPNTVTTSEDGEDDTYDEDDDEEYEEEEEEEEEEIVLEPSPDVDTVYMFPTSEDKRTIDFSLFLPPSCCICFFHTAYGCVACAFSLSLCSRPFLSPPFS